MWRPTSQGSVESRAITKFKASVPGYEGIYFTLGSTKDAKWVQRYPPEADLLGGNIQLETCFGPCKNDDQNEEACAWWAGATLAYVLRRQGVRNKGLGSERHGEHPGNVRHWLLQNYGLLQEQDVQTRGSYQEPWGEQPK